MSFTGNIKSEISSIEYSDSEKTSELSAILNIGIKLYEDKFEIILENLSIARRIYKLIKDIYHIEIDLDSSGTNTLRKNKIVVLTIKDKIDLILNDLSILDNDERIYIPKSYLVDEDRDKMAYLRGIFEICGSINDPKTSRYHLEFVIQNEKTANYVNSLLNSFYLNSKILKRNKNYMVYIKEAEKISDFIRMLNATNSLFYYEDIRIYRDHKNMTNRLNNCEQANVEKIFNASQEQLELIKKLKEITDFDLLDDKIKTICIYKEKYPESSMNELADIISSETEKKITKSCINHRFRKIKDMIEKSNEYK